MKWKVHYCYMILCFFFANFMFIFYLFFVVVDNSYYFVLAFYILIFGDRNVLVAILCLKIKYNQ